MNSCPACGGEGSIPLHRASCSATHGGDCDCLTHVDVSCPRCGGDTKNWTSTTDAGMVSAREDDMGAKPDERLNGLSLDEDCACGNAPTCVGSYEGAPVIVGCDRCCGHGNEDGWCVDLVQERHARELVAARAAGYAEAREQAATLADERKAQMRQLAGVEPPATGIWVVYDERSYEAGDIARTIRAMEPKKP